MGKSGPEETWYTLRQSIMGNRQRPSTWTSTYSSCAGSSQSPINIVTANAVSQTMDELTLTGFGSSAPSGAAMSLSNNGHTVVVTLTGDYLVTGGGLPSDYKAVQFHFHWGNSSSEGSEHTVDGTQYAAEMHIVCYDYQNYGTVTDAVDASEGLAVLGTLITVGGSENTAFASLTDQLSQVTDKNGTHTFNSTFNIESMLPSDLTSFYRYDGSLTTPLCNESVVWTVFEDTVSISQAQIEAFRAVEFEDGTPMVNNYRPPQSLNGRTVYIRSGVTIPVASLTLLLASFVVSWFTQLH
ncbi:carbonic anhydrase 1-like [Glandiceps talaboti]